ncbi:MAG: CHAT domain-containing protein [Chloroflexi bacterium]|nr:CHAT domain-containing protein [Chloroflexota bacterium]MBU1747088.1 CHAT domain-containing protein [Chloroflexota bacterium]
MAVEQLVSELLAVAEAERRDWLAAHRPVVNLALMEALKTAAEKHMLSDTRRAREIAEVAVEAASFAALADPLVMALALWAKGNVLIYAGDFAACVEAYQIAEAAYAAQGDGLAVARLQGNRVFALVNLGQHREALLLAETARQGLEAVGQTASVYLAVLEMNVGVACRQSSDYEAALAAYERGRAIFEQLGNAVQVARMDINRAKALEKLDRFQEATPLLEAARATLAEQGVALDVARADLNLAHLAFRRGRYSQALEWYDQARAGFAALQNEMELATIDFCRAQVYLALNLFAEAYEWAGLARQAFAARGMTRYAIQSTAGQAAAARGRGDLAEAAALFAQARAGLAERGEAIEVALIDLQQAALLQQDGQLQAALDAARAAAAVLERHGLAVRLAQARLTMADSLLALDQVEEATSLYTAALEVADKEELPTLAYRARYGLGQVAEAHGHDEAARRDYEAALAHLEAIHRYLQVDEFQASFLDDKLAVYEAAVRLALRRGDVETAFDYVERAKAGALLDLLARGLEVLAAREEGDALLARLQALREEWHWHFSQLEGYAPGEEDRPVRSDEPGRRATVRDVERQLSNVWRQLRLRQHRYATLGEGQRLSSAEVRARLPEDAALITYYAVGKDLLAFLVHRAGVEVVELGTTAAEIETLIGVWRFDLDSLRLRLPDLAPDGLAILEIDSRVHLQRLYQALVAPLSRQLTDYRRLIIVPHQALYYLPLAALHDGQQYLVERFQFSYLPGASLLSAQALGEATGRHDPRYPLVLAHSDEGRLPRTVSESRQVADILGGARLFVEDEATEARLREHGPACGLLHLATHGAFRSDNPFFSWLRLAGDTRLTVRDVYGLRLPHTSLVTLSACETGLGDLRGGDVLGLSQGFMAAGARSLLLSLWAVDDASTAQLMTAFYHRLVAGQDKTTALCEAQCAVRERYPHPFYWAGFVLVGDTGKTHRGKTSDGASIGVRTG